MHTNETKTLSKPNKESTPKQARLPAFFYLMFYHSKKNPVQKI
jgi:hypothetical protein